VSRKYPLHVVKTGDAMKMPREIWPVGVTGRSFLGSAEEFHLSDGIPRSHFSSVYPFVPLTMSFPLLTLDCSPPSFEYRNTHNTPQQRWYNDSQFSAGAV
jgi:hypothetical protein